MKKYHFYKNTIYYSLIILISTMLQEPPHSVTIKLTPNNSQDKQYIDIIGKVLAVDKEIDQKNVLKEIVINEEGVSIRISANQVKLLRACVNGILKHTRLVSQTIKEFKDTL